MSDSKLSVLDKYARRQEATNPDGTINVEILDWEENGDEHIRFKFLTPSNDVKQESMKIPEAGADLESYKLHQLLEYLGLNVQTIDLAEGETVPANKRGSSWSLAPDASITKTRTERALEISKNLDFRNVAQFVITWIFAFAIVTMALGIAFLVITA